MYTELFNLHAKLLQSLAHPKRLEIVHLLRDHSLSVSEIQSMLGLPQANLSQHLQILRKLKVVSTTRKGKQIYYHLTHPNFIAASDLVRQILIDQKLSTPLKTPNIYTDPVCGMHLTPQTAAFSHNYQGKTYYFCATGCLKQFKSSHAKD